MEIMIAGEINEGTLAALNDLPEEEILVKINSYGGDVGSALAIYNRLKAIEDRVTIEIEGIACSAATLIACAGHCRMAKNALYMIHSPLVDLFGTYNSADIAKNYDALQKIEEQMLNIYIEKTWMDKNVLTAMLMSETWLTSEEAKSKGFVDEITGEYANAEEDLETQTVKVNGIVIPLGKFSNRAPLKMMAAAVKPAFAIAPSEQKSLIGKLKALLNGKTSAREQALMTECNRLRAELLKVQDELGKAQAQMKASEALFALIRDNVESGASNVSVSMSDAFDAKDDAIAKVVNYANRGR